MWFGETDHEPAMVTSEIKIFVIVPISLSSQYHKLYWSFAPVHRFTVWDPSSEEKEIDLLWMQEAIAKLFVISSRLIFLPFQAGDALTTILVPSIVHFVYWCWSYPIISNTAWFTASIASCQASLEWEELGCTILFAFARCSASRDEPFSRIGHRRGSKRRCVPQDFY